MNSLPPLKPGGGGALSSLSRDYAPFPSLQMARQQTPLMRKLNASILCLLPNLVSPIPLSISILPCHTQLLLDSVSFAPEMVGKFLTTLNSNSATGLDGISSRVLKSCSVSLSHPPSALFTQSFALGHLLSAFKSANITSLN